MACTLSEAEVAAEEMAEIAVTKVNRNRAPSKELSESSGSGKRRKDQQLATKAKKAAEIASVNHAAQDMFERRSQEIFTLQEKVKERNVETSKLKGEVQELKTSLGAKELVIR